MTALKCEARGLAKAGLKAEVAGTGERAAKFVRKLTAEYASEEGAETRAVPQQGLINVGCCCAAGIPKGTVLVINSVRNEQTGKTYYPDILFAHDEREASLVTSDKIVTDPEPGVAYDMEGALIAEEVPGRMRSSGLLIVKVVSDDGSNIPNAEEVKRLMGEASERIAALAAKFEETFAPDKLYAVFNEADRQKIHEDMKLSAYMRNELEELEHYCVCAGKEQGLKKEMDKLYEDGSLPCASRKEARRLMDGIYESLR